MIRRTASILIPLLSFATGCTSIAGLNDLQEVDCVGDACGAGGENSQGGAGGSSAGTGGKGGSAGSGGAGSGGVAGSGGTAGSGGGGAGGSGGSAGDAGAAGDAGSAGTDGGSAGTDGGSAGTDGGSAGTDGGSAGTDGGASGSGGSDGGSAGSDGGSAGSDGGSAGSSSCVPTTCEALGRNCGDVDDGCGSTINCGTCQDPLSCGAAPNRPNLCGCSPNSFVCSGNELRQCTADGSATFLVAYCPDGACNAGEGKCNTCTPGDKYCSGKQLFVCNAAGDGGTPQGSPCLSSQICDPKGLGTCDLCVESGYFCVGANLRKCNDSGSSTSLVDSCDNDKLCQRGVFLGKCPTPVCQPGEKRCSGAQAQVCNANQDGWDTVDTCATAALCGKTDVGVCDAPVCNIGETSCEGNSQKVCNSDRTDFDLIPCKLPAPVCENGVCSARGPTMIQALSSDGTPFYIDTTEVTAGQYQKFLDAAVTPQSETGTPSVCSWNASYWEEPVPITQNGADLPAVKVDWCDAYAYCQWAGKRLCGKIGGGSLVPAEINNRAASMWYAACRGPDDTAYPYGNAYSGSSCNGNDFGKGSAYTVGSSAQCVGGFDGLYDMSGNVQEWDDSCSSAQGASDACRVRGGFFSSTLATALACDASTTVVRNVHTAPGIGFRCCGDL